MAPPQVHRFPSWNLNVVLHALTGIPFEPIRTIPLRMLALKALFLVAITSARWVSELGALSIREDLCIFHKDKVILRTDPTFRPKRDSIFHISQEICLPTFFHRTSNEQEKIWHKLDVQRTLRIYIKRTASFRQSDTLFIYVQPPRLGHRLPSSAISKALKACITESYLAQRRPIPQGLTAHSVRSMATNAAFTHNASPLEVCRAATWSSLSTFVRHYKIKGGAAFGRSVLQHVMNQSGDVPPGN